MTVQLARSDAGEPGGIAGWVVELMDTLGGPGAAVAVCVDNVFPPLPSELVLPVAGFSAANGTLSLVEVLLWTTAGSVLGAIIVFYLGRLLGRERTRWLVCKLPLLRPADVDKAEEWFARHGTKAVFLGRMVPLVRSLVSLPAGVQKMPFWTFLGLTTAGSLLWNSVFVVAGYALGANWHLVGRYASVFQLVVIVLAVVAATLFVVKRLRDRARTPGRRA
ncbi:DedA family protein [Prauserella flavalba]|uniref:VTT domain-containing protein n=1 Tax=Prauserella flavalba TaxID=1477506 RepID=A0A318LW98_9PSEU|nr:DedA family protein [Prauserella flavalba]PXY30512.1 hypothetical protein BA062_18280 [Prauserella flavalba]